MLGRLVFEMLVGIFETKKSVGISVLFFALNVERLVGNVSRLGGYNTVFVSDAIFVILKAGPPFVDGSQPLEDWYLILALFLLGPLVTTRFLTWICLLGVRGGLLVLTEKGLNLRKTAWQMPWSPF